MMFSKNYRSDVLDQLLLNDHFLMENRNKYFNVNCDVIRAKDGHYVNITKGLYGRQKKENVLLSMGEQTSFPCWNSMATSNKLLRKKKMKDVQPMTLMQHIKDGNLNDKIKVNLRENTPPITKKARTYGKKTDTAPVQVQSVNSTVDSRKMSFESDSVVSTENYKNELKNFSCKYFLTRKVSAIELGMSNKTKELQSGVRRHSVSTCKHSRKESHEKHHKISSPSHYKGKHKGTYIAAYDPHITAQKPRDRSRSKSLFVNSDSFVKQVLTSRLLASVKDKIHVEEQCDSLTKFDEFIAQHGSILCLSRQNSLVKDAEEYLPVVRNGKKSFLRKAKSFNIGIKVDEKNSEKTNLMQLHSGTATVPRSFLHTTKRSNEDLVYGYSSESEHSSLSSRSSRSRKASLSSRSSRDSWDENKQARKSRASSSFDGAPEEHLQKLERKFDHARRRISKSSSSTSLPFSKSSSSTSLPCGNAQTVQTTEVHEAVKSGDVATLKGLIAKNADVNVPDQSGFPPLHYALAAGKDDCMTVLLAGGANMHDYFQQRRLKYFN